MQEVVRAVDKLQGFNLSLFQTVLKLLKPLDTKGKQIRFAVILQLQIGCRLQRLHTGQIALLLVLLIG